MRAFLRISLAALNMTIALGAGRPGSAQTVCHAANARQEQAACSGPAPATGRPACEAKTDKESLLLLSRNRERMLTQSLVDAQTRLRATGDLRQARADDLAKQRHSYRARICHHEEMAVLRRQLGAAAKEHRRAVQDIERNRTAYVLDADGYRVSWPPMLRDREVFVGLRRAVDQLLAQRRRHDAGWTSEDFESAARAIGCMAQSLRQTVRDESPQSYAANRRFLGDLQVHLKMLSERSAVAGEETLAEVFRRRQMSLAAASRASRTAD